MYLKSKSLIELLTKIKIYNQYVLKGEKMFSSANEAETYFTNRMKTKIVIKEIGSMVKSNILVVSMGGAYFGFLGLLLNMLKV
jgi:hypothetical protein